MTDVLHQCAICSGKGRVLDRGKSTNCPHCHGTGSVFQRVTHASLPGRNRQEKRLNAKLAQKAYLADKRAQQVIA